jgi:hypothetical protein
MGRSIWAVFIGVLVAALWIAALGFVEAIVFPWPEDLQIDDAEAVGRVINEKPQLLDGVAVVWFLGTVIGGWYGSRTARRAYVIHGLIVGLCAMGIGIIHLRRWPHPAWFWGVGLAVFPIAGLLGGFAAKRNQPAPQKQNAV